MENQDHGTAGEPQSKDIPKHVNRRKRDDEGCCPNLDWEDERDRVQVVILLCTYKRLVAVEVALSF